MCFAPRNAPSPRLESRIKTLFNNHFVYDCFYRNVCAMPDIALQVGGPGMQRFLQGLLSPICPAST